MTDVNANCVSGVLYQVELSRFIEICCESFEFKVWQCFWNKVYGELMADFVFILWYSSLNDKN